MDSSSISPQVSSSLLLRASFGLILLLCASMFHIASAQSSARLDNQDLDMILVIDSSNSMDVSGLWTPVSNGIRAFINEPSSEFLTMALNFMPAPADMCTGEAYDPPFVPLTPLPFGASTLENAILARSPGGMTPTFSALKGSLEFAEAYANESPTRGVSVVLLHGGPPNDCSTDTGAIIALAANASARVRTYTIGLSPGSPVPLLSGIAGAGSGAYFQIGQLSIEQEVVDALVAIQELELARIFSDGFESG